MGKVTKKKLKKYGWVEYCHDNRFVRHPNYIVNGVSYYTIDKEVTSRDRLFTPCPTMSQLKSYVLEHTGEKMQKVKPRKLELPNNVVVDLNKIPNVLIDQSGNGNHLVKKPIELPKRWEDIFIQEGTNIEWLKADGNLRELKSQGGIVSNSEKNTLPKGLGKPMLATCQLLLLRDIYRQGWKPDWNDGNQDKFCIFLDKERLKTTNNLYFTEIFTFQDAQTRDLFLDNFKPLLQEHYKLYN